MYDVIVEILHCYKCVLLFVIQNNVNLFNFIITILEIAAVVNALQFEAAQATSALSRFTAELLIILRILHTLCHVVTLTFDLFTLNF